MESFKPYYLTHLTEEIPAAFRDPVKSSHPVGDMHETSRDGLGGGHVSAIQDEASVPATNTELLRPAPSTLNERDEQLEDSNNSSVMKQTNGIEQLSLESKDQSLSKPIRAYLDEGLPDLLRSGSPLRRRVSSPMSDTVRHLSIQFPSLITYIV